MVLNLRCYRDNIDRNCLVLPKKDVLINYIVYITYYVGTCLLIHKV